MRVIVTGGAGFIGSHLVDELIKRGDEVTIIDNFATGLKKNLNKKAILYRGEPTNVEDYFAYRPVDGQVDVIFHLAALARIQPSFERPFETYLANSTGTVVALEMAKYHKARFVYAGSSSAYHDVHCNPYSYTKWLGEQHCKLYHKVYELPCAIARFFNVYGPRQIDHGPWATVIGIFERQWSKGEKLTITGTGKQRRDFTHVKDIVSGLIAMSLEDWHATTFNLGTGKNFSINEVASMFGGEVTYIPKRPGEAETTQADLKFTKQMLEWKPTMKLKDYIEEIVSGK